MQVFDRDAFGKTALLNTLPHPHPQYFHLAPKFPSRYDEVPSPSLGGAVARRRSRTYFQATAWQMGRLQDLKQEWNDPVMEERLRGRLGADTRV